MGDRNDNEAKGSAVLVCGYIVAWFADFDQAAQEWCTENHFGEWLVVRAKCPRLVPPSKKEIEAIEREARELSAKITGRKEAT